MTNENTQDEPSEVDASGSSHCSLDCPYAAGRLADILCEFCEIPLCQKCERQNTFGSCCVSCNSDVETGVIDEHGFREACMKDAEEMDRFGIPYPTPPEIWKCGGQIIDSMLDE